MQSGDLKWRIGFYQRPVTSDGYGNAEADYSPSPDFIAPANLRAKLGGETVLAGRLAGNSYVNITVRRSSATAAVTDKWQAKDEVTGIPYNIRSIIDPDGKRQWIEMLCEQGVAV